MHDFAPAWVRLLGAVMLCVLLSACGDEAPLPEVTAPPALEGMWRVAVDRTVDVATEGIPLIEHPEWVTQLTAETYVLTLAKDGTFTLENAQAAGQGTLALAGSWVVEADAPALTITSVGGQDIPVADRKTERWVRDGHHLVMSQDTDRYYFEKVRAD